MRITTGRSRVAGLGLEQPAGLVAVHARHRHVEDHELDVFGDGLLDGLQAVAGGDHREARLRRASSRSCGGRAGCRRRSGPWGGAPMEPPGEPGVSVNVSTGAKILARALGTRHRLRTRAAALYVFDRRIARLHAQRTPCSQPEGAPGRRMASRKNADRRRSWWWPSLAAGVVGVSVTRDRRSRVAVQTQKVGRKPTWSRSSPPPARSSPSASSTSAPTSRAASRTSRGQGGRDACTKGQVLARIDSTRFEAGDAPVRGRRWRPRAPTSTRAEADLEVSRLAFERTQAHARREADLRPGLRPGRGRAAR